MTQTANIQDLPLHNWLLLPAGRGGGGGQGVTHLLLHLPVPVAMQGKTGQDKGLVKIRYSLSHAGGTSYGSALGVVFCTEMCPWKLWVCENRFIPPLGA